MYKIYKDFNIFIAFEDDDDDISTLKYDNADIRCDGDVKVCMTPFLVTHLVFEKVMLYIAAAKRNNMEFSSYKYVGQSNVTHA